MDILSEINFMMTMMTMMMMTGEACSAPAEPGPCRASIRMFYYNTSSGDCEEFMYGGCNGNENKYDTLEQCQRACASQQRRNNKP